MKKFSLGPKERAGTQKKVFFWQWDDGKRLFFHPSFSKNGFTYDNVVHLDTGLWPILINQSVEK